LYIHADSYKPLRLELGAPKFNFGFDIDLDFDTEVEHGNDRCQCCSSKKVVEENERMRELKWKEIKAHRKLLKQQKERKQEQEYFDRWEKERQRFEDLIWRLY
jgi:hypothetical protein